MESTFEQNIDIMLPEIKRQLLKGADRIVLTVAKVLDGEKVLCERAVVCKPEFN
jgi:hypothetical protein